jgi:2-polyprenyl-3-methyl-5-hydroxy-6-metoxy-1,4-benzoquinol methylase
LRDSAAADDKSYRLRDITATTFRFRVKPGAQIDRLDGSEAEIYCYLQQHPDSQMNDLRAHVPSLGEIGYEHYNQERNTVAGMVERGLLEISGEVPLETVDPRYERIDSCDLCGAPSANHPILFWKHNTPVVRCTSCGLVYANPRWKTEYLFGKYTPEHWEHYAETIRSTAVDPAANEALYDPHLNHLEPSRKSGRLLDVGCASGEFLMAAQARGWQVYGVEPSPIGAALAERILGATIHTGTLDTAPWPHGYFDAVGLFEVIEHLQSPHAYIEKIAALLRPGGMLIMSTPNIHSLAYSLLGRDWQIIGPNDHIYYFSPRTLERLLKSCGFALHHLHTLGTTPETWKRWLRVEPLQKLAPIMPSITQPVTGRLLTGEDIFLVARR